MRTIAEIHRCEPTFRQVVEFTLKKKTKKIKSFLPFVWKNQQNLWGEEKKKHLSRSNWLLNLPHWIFFLFLHLYIQISPCLKRAQWLEHLFICWGIAPGQARWALGSGVGWFGQHLQPLMTKNLRPKKEVIGIHLPIYRPINRVLFTLLWTNPYF